MISTRRVGACVPFADLVRREESSVDQLTEHLLGRFVGRIAEYRQQFVPFPDGSGAFGGYEVAEEFADDGDALDADAVDGGLGVAGERASYATDVLIRLASEEARLPVALLPQPGGGEREKGECTALALDLGEHSVNQLIVLEAVAAFRGGLYQGSP